MGKEILRVTDPTFSNTALPMSTDWNFKPMCVPVSTSKLHSQWYVGQFPYTGRLLFLLKTRRKQREKEELKTKQTVITTTAKKKKTKNHPTLCPFKCSQPAKLPGFALTGCLPFKMKREAATDGNKGQLFGDAIPAQAHVRRLLFQERQSLPPHTCLDTFRMHQPALTLTREREDLAKLHVSIQT